MANSNFSEFYVPNEKYSDNDKTNFPTVKFLKEEVFLWMTFGD